MNKFLVKKKNQYLIEKELVVFGAEKCNGRFGPKGRTIREGGVKLLGAEGFLRFWRQAMLALNPLLTTIKMVFYYSVWGAS